ncbi:cyclin-like protein [Neocallimastix lanati (nom. inval.)]|nr:cyclin-like protein [Neocallimastix sp. JGI-2020a]
MAYQRTLYSCNDFTNNTNNQNQISYINPQHSKGNEYANIPNQYSSSCPQLNINYQQQSLCMNANTQLQQKQQLHYKSQNAYNSLNRNGTSYVISNKITPSSSTTFPILSLSNQSSFGPTRRQISQQSNIHQTIGFSTITPSPDQDSVMPLPVYNSNNPTNNNEILMHSSSISSNVNNQIDSQHQHYIQKAMPPTQVHKKSKIHLQSTHHHPQVQQHKHQQQQTWGPFIVEDDNELVNVDEYAEDILEYLKNQELCTMPEANYMAYQNEITTDMRRILIEWLIEVHGEYDLKPETLYLTVNLIDRYLSKRIVPKSDFQLLGVTALWVAAKYEEAHGKIPSLNQMKYICCKYYDEPEFIQMEMRLLEEMNFSIGHPTPEAFLKLQLLLSNYDRTTRPAIKALAKYIMETSLIDYNFIRFTPSIISKSSIILAVNILNQKSWSYINDDLWDCVRSLIEKIIDPPKSIYKKYSLSKYMRTSIIAKQLIVSNPKFKNLTSQNFDSNSLVSGPLPSSTSIQILTTTSNSTPVTDSSDPNNSKNNKHLTTTFTIITTSTTTTTSSPRDSMSTDMEQFDNEYISNNSMPTPPKETILSTPSMIVNNNTIPPSSQGIPYTSSYNSINNNQWISSVNNIINLGNVNGMNTINQINTINNISGMNSINSINNINNLNNINHRNQRNSLGRMGMINSIRNVNSNDNLIDDIKKINIINMNRMGTKNMNMDISDLNLKQYQGKSTGKIYTMMNNNMNNNMNNKIDNFNTNV